MQRPLRTTRIGKLPLPAGLVLAAGGIITILAAAVLVRNVELWTAAIASGTVVLSGPRGASSNVRPPEGVAVIPFRV